MRRQGGQSSGQAAAEAIDELPAAVGIEDFVQLSKNGPQA
jgi:hypothetical protein